MSEQKFPTPPSSFVFCQVQGCPLASTCLRAKALPYADPEANSIFCVNSNAHAAIGALSSRKSKSSPSLTVL